MNKKYTSLGLMSGTSGDGIDASIILSDGIDHFETVKDRYFEYDSGIYKEFHLLKERIANVNDLKKLKKEIRELERKITLHHAKVVQEFNLDQDNCLVGFHGQTIYHNPEERISLQLGDGKLLNQLTQKKIIFNFRKNDIQNGGEGAPLTPIFHQLLVNKNKIKLPVCILNIGGISNATIIKKPTDSSEIYSRDIGPGNCLIDAWVRKNSDKKFDKEGALAASGKKNEIIFEQAQELYFNRKKKEKLSFDTNDFDISFSRGLSLEDGAKTLTVFSASIIADQLSNLISKDSNVKEFLICGGGRKNKILLHEISKRFSDNISFKLIDDYGLNGDFIESQAFAFLAIRSYKNIPISFPNTTNCKKPITGGEIIGN